jgi:hypothetical protein
MCFLFRYCYRYSKVIRVIVTYIAVSDQVRVNKGGGLVKSKSMFSSCAQSAPYDRQRLITGIGRSLWWLWQEDCQRYITCGLRNFTRLVSFFCFVSVLILFSAGPQGNVLMIRALLKKTALKPSAPYSHPLSGSSCSRVMTPPVLEISSREMFGCRVI